MHIDDLLLALRISYAKNYAQFSEEALTRQIDDIRGERLPRYQKEFWVKEARRTFRYSFLLRYYALFESHLRAICERVQAQEKLAIGLSDLRNDSFLKSVDLYFTKVAGLPSPAVSKYWNDIIVYSQIRNLVIHRNGVLSANPGEIVKRIQRLKTVSIDRKGQVFLTKRFSSGMLICMSGFMSNLETHK